MAFATQHSLPAVFMRGGTSKALMFHLRDLPTDRAAWSPIFLAAIGSPDPYARQLNGMGGGVSSLSKVCVIGPSTRDDADLDYTFAQVLVNESRVDYSGNCGNMSSAVGPFALDEGLLPHLSTTTGEVCVRIHNTNTKKIIHARFPAQQGRAVVAGAQVIPGVSGAGAAVRLEFLSPGGATTGQLLPTGRVCDSIDVPGLGTIDVSMIDAANACVFVRANDLGFIGTEMPDVIEQRVDVMQTLAAIRASASVAMGITPDLAAARAKTAVPFVGFVSAPQQATTLDGAMISADDADLTVRMLSNGQPHRALPLTASLCTAVAAALEGSIVQQLCTRSPEVQRESGLRLAMPSGVLTVGAEVERHAQGWHATRGTFYRTARRLFDGRVYF